MCRLGPRCVALVSSAMVARVQDRADNPVRMVQAARVEVEALAGLELCQELPVRTYSLLLGAFWFISLG